LRLAWRQSYDITNKCNERCGVCKKKKSP